MLYLIGLGLENEDISTKAIKAMKSCSSLYLDSYTSLGINSEQLSSLIKKPIIPVQREFLENKLSFILGEAKTKDVAVLVQGDCLSATTHITLLLECKKHNIKYEIIHGISILTSIGETGLSLYNFGKTASIPFQRTNLKVPYQILKDNQKSGMHTLFLLDLDPKNNKFLSIPDAISYLLSQGMKDCLCIACCNLGTGKKIIKAGKARELLKENFHNYPQCLIIPGKTHFIEEEFLEQFRI